jgi:release factor glutamine methyltransferase
MNQGLPRIQELCSQAAFFLKQEGVEAYRLEAELLLSMVLGKTRTRLLIDALDTVGTVEQTRFQELLERRATGEPVQYLQGHTEFMGREFIITPDVLIPRDDTAVLVETAVRELAGKKDGLVCKVLDLCTGSGIVAVTLSLELGISILASDISKQALAVAENNAKLLGARIDLREGNLFQAMEETDGPFDLIASNPPYISAHEMGALQREVKQEPELALYGGADGLDYYRSIAEGAMMHLKPGGLLLLEIGYSQAPAVEELLSEAGFIEPLLKHDMAGHPRVVGARRSI